MRKTGNLLGLFLTLVGIFLLFGNLGLIELDWNNLWPIFPLFLGLFFFLQYLNHKDKGIIIPATLFTGIGVFFLMFTLPNGVPWSQMSQWWPIIPMILGFGFFLAYLADMKDSGLLIPATVLLVVGGVSLSNTVSWTKSYLRYWPVLLILIGVVIFLGNLMVDVRGSKK
jgi:hypothetical protein